MLGWSGIRNVCIGFLLTCAPRSPFSLSSLSRWLAWVLFLFSRVSPAPGVVAAGRCWLRALPLSSSSLSCLLCPGRPPPLGLLLFFFSFFFFFSFLLHCTLYGCEQLMITIPTQIMADEFNFLWSEIQNCIAEADADLNSCPRPIRATWQMQIWCLAVFMLWCFLFVADLIVGMEELELHYRCRVRSNFRKIRIAIISVRMITSPLRTHEFTTRR